MTLQEIYEQTIKPLPTKDRLRIASFILNDIADSAVDVSSDWSDDDLHAFATAGWKQIDEALGDSEDGQAR